MEGGRKGGKRGEREGRREQIVEGREKKEEVIVVHRRIKLVRSLQSIQNPAILHNWRHSLGSPLDTRDMFFLSCSLTALPSTRGNCICDHT